VVTDFEACIAGGGVAVFPADTVYGLACDPEDPAAVERLYELKGRAPDKPAAVMFFDVERALGVLDDLGPRVEAAVRALLPGGVTLLLANPARRFPLACTGDPETLGVRVPAGSPLRGARVAVLQSSANHAGDPAPRSLGEVPEDIRRGVRLALDGGVLPGVASTVVDLRGYEDGGGWSVAREGAVGAAELEAALGPAA
jgi:L-threonylcarbamoyladenylate synthase